MVANALFMLQVFAPDFHKGIHVNVLSSKMMKKMIFEILVVGKYAKHSTSFCT